jgi:hypothetical protein
MAWGNGWWRLHGRRRRGRDVYFSPIRQSDSGSLELDVLHLGRHRNLVHVRMNDVVGGLEVSIRVLSGWGEEGQPLYQTHVVRTQVKLPRHFDEFAAACGGSAGRPVVGKKKAEELV